MDTKNSDQTEENHLKIDQILTVEEVAKFLRLKPATVREKAKLHELPAKKVGKFWRFNQSEIEAWWFSHGNQ